MINDLNSSENLQLAVIPSNRAAPDLLSGEVSDGLQITALKLTINMNTLTRPLE
jgi:hypothetical protein